MRAIQITEFGGPEVLVETELPEPEPDDGQMLVRVSSAGVNYADTHQTEDSYLSSTRLPTVPGSEVVGTTEDGRRVCGFAASGGYAELAVVDETLAFEVPDGVDDGAALCLPVQGLTAWHLLRTSAHLQEGESVVVHAAAGGVGSLAVQLARAWGAGAVVGGASSEDKRALAMELGATAVFDSRADDPEAAMAMAAEGRVDIVLDMVGGATTDASLASLAPFGRLVHYGMASREAPRRVAPPDLMRGSHAIVGFWLVDAMRDPRGMVVPQMAELLGLVANGDLRTVVHPPYPLGEARRAHEDLLARSTTGKVVLDCTS